MLVRKILRPVTQLMPFTPNNGKILLKYFSNTSGEDDDENSNVNESVSICPICGCLCGNNNDPPVNMYDSRKYGHRKPGNNTRPDFPILPDIPTDVFRNTEGERLGPQGQARKQCMYKNPEYFSFQHMTYYDMHENLRRYRNPCPNTGRKVP